MSHDLNQFKKQTNFRLVLGGFFLLFVVGGGLVLLVYGPSAAASALFCLAGGTGVILIITGVLWLMDWIVRHANRE